jgi:hypothetical protein
MSSLWTPGGERPVQREQPTAGADAEREPTQEEIEAAMAEELAAIQNTPARYIVGNHAIQLFELARIYLTAQPPRFDDAQLSIDGMAALVEGLSGRLGEDEKTLVDGLAQIRLAFVQLKAATDAPPAAP